MTLKKKFLCLAMVAMLTCINWASVHASSNNNNEQSAIPSVQTVSMTQEQQDIENTAIDEVLRQYNPYARGDYAPESIRETMPYTASFPASSKITSTYTGVAFYPNSDGEIKISLSDLNCVVNGDLTITCYDWSTNSSIVSWVGKAPQANKHARFYNLPLKDAKGYTKAYYFKFTCSSPNYISGSASIYH